MSDATEGQTCFVASPSKSGELLACLADAIDIAGKGAAKFRFQLWTQNDIAGRALVAPILQNIATSPLFVADITFLNLNVTYEVGYAIGQSKRAILIRNTSFKGDLDLSNDIGIFDTLGRHEYRSAQGLPQDTTQR